MKKNFLMLFAVLFAMVSYGQDKKEPILEKKDNMTVVTYFHDNGEIQQKGAFNTNGKLQGEWISFDNKGNKVALGNYENGKKVGKWFFWNGNSLSEVDYIDSRIVNVNEWDNKTKVAINDK